MTALMEVIENFDDMESKSYFENEGFSRPGMSFFLHSRASGPAAMSIRKMTIPEGPFKGMILALHSGKLDITLANSASIFGFWFLDALEGFNAVFFNEAGKEIGRLEEPGYGDDNSPKELRFEGANIKKISITEPDYQTLLIDHVFAMS